MGHPGSGRSHLSARFMHQFVLINAIEFSNETLEQIFSVILDRGFENYGETVSK
jgi:hypothetical protein